MDLSLGLRAYTGWAIAITLGGDPHAPRVLDRRRLVLRAPELPGELYHVANGLESDAASRLIAQAIEASEAAAFAAVTALVADLRATGPVRLAGLVVGRGPPRTPLRHARMSHSGLHAAEGELYRYTLLEAAAKAALDVSIFVEADLPVMAETALGLSAADLTSQLKRMGAEIGPPWTQREKSAALAAWIALAGGSAGLSS